ncbi:hypothetical protein Emed_005751 [Eimeria media]
MSQQQEASPSQGRETTGVQPLSPGGQPAPRTTPPARPQPDRAARERERRVVPGRFRFTDLRQVQVVRHVLAHPSSQRELIHKELVYLHRRLKAYRALRLELKRVGPDNIVQYAAQRNFEEPSAFFIDTLHIPLQGLPDPVTLRGLWPDPFLRLEEQWDRTYINEFPEVMVLRDTSSPMWNDFLTPYARHFLACPTEAIEALRHWRPIPYVCEFASSMSPLDVIMHALEIMHALQLAAHDRLREAQVDERAARRWARSVEKRMVRCREHLEHLERLRLGNQQDLAAARLQMQQQVHQTDGDVSAVSPNAQPAARVAPPAPAPPAAPRRVRARRAPRRAPRRSPAPAPAPPPSPSPPAVVSAQRSTAPPSSMRTSPAEHTESNEPNYSPSSTEVQQEQSERGTEGEQHQVTSGQQQQVERHQHTREELAQVLRQVLNRDDSPPRRVQQSHPRAEQKESTERLGASREDADERSQLEQRRSSPPRVRRPRPSRLVPYSSQSSESSKSSMSISTSPTGARQQASPVSSTPVVTPPLPPVPPPPVPSRTPTSPKFTACRSSGETRGRSREVSREKSVREQREHRRERSHEKGKRRRHETETREEVTHTTPLVPQHHSTKERETHEQQQTQVTPQQVSRDAREHGGRSAQHEEQRSQVSSGQRQQGAEQQREEQQSTGQQHQRRTEARGQHSHVVITPGTGGGARRRRRRLRRLAVQRSDSDEESQSPSPKRPRPEP